MTFVLLYMASVDNVTIARVMLSRKKNDIRLLKLSRFCYFCFRNDYNTKLKHFNNNYYHIQ